LGKRPRDILVLGNVTHEALGPRKRRDQILGFFRETLVLIGDGEVHSGGVQALGNRPGNRTLVGHSKDDRVPAFEVKRHVGLLGEWERIQEVATAF